MDKLTELKKQRFEIYHKDGYTSEWYKLLIESYDILIKDNKSYINVAYLKEQRDDTRLKYLDTKAKEENSTGSKHETTVCKYIKTNSVLLPNGCIIVGYGHKLYTVLTTNGIMQYQESEMKEIHGVDVITELMNTVILDNIGTQTD